MMYFGERLLWSDANTRPENQDRGFYLVHESASTDGDTSSQIGIYCVLDGVSNSNGKQAVLAAQTALQRSLEQLALKGAEMAAFPEAKREKAVFYSLYEAMIAADTAVSEYHDCCCTMSAAVVLKGWVYTMNVGDSPIYLFHKASRYDDDLLMEELFYGQNEAYEAYRTGKISEEEMLTGDLGSYLSAFVIGQHPQQCPDDVKFQSFPLDGYNILLLGTDGALSVLTKASLRSIVEEEHFGGLSAVKAAVKQEIDRFPDKDNATVLGQIIMCD